MEFFKYQGTGNDFVMIDNRANTFPKSTTFINQLCDRRFGVGGDGLILLEHSSTESADFKMVYYNSDGNESTMCGNGGRCIVAFAHFLGIFKDKCTFTAIDGLHEASISQGIVKLKMIDVSEIFIDGENKILNTGSPHLVKYVKNLEDFLVYKEGSALRNSENYKKDGINVNFVEKMSDDEIFVRTYERGVEDETYSCGTGATAAALTFLKDSNTSSVEVQVLGGHLKVYASKKDTGFENIWLEGPATQVFSGNIEL